MLLIFNLGRPDVLPVDAFGVRRGFQIAHRKGKLPEPVQLPLLGKRRAPRRTAETQAHQAFYSAFFGPGYGALPKEPKSSVSGSSPDLPSSSKSERRPASTCAQNFSDVSGG